MLERKTLRRGRSAVPLTLLRMRNFILIRLSTFFSDYNNTIFNRFTNITYEATNIFALIISEKRLVYVERQKLLEMLEQKAKNVIHLGLLFKQLKNEETEECDKLIRRFLPDINQSYKGQESFDITEKLYPGAVRQTEDSPKRGNQENTGAWCLLSHDGFRFCDLQRWLLLTEAPLAALVP